MPQSRLSCLPRPNANLNISPRTAAGELPRLFELDPLRFQEMCRDLLQAEPQFVAVEVYGTPGQLQRGIDIHLASQQLGRPLSFWYHRLPLVNESSDSSGSGGAFVQNGWRTGPSLKLSPEDTVHLHADLTALLTAAHFDLLDKVEASFGPITLAHGALVALAAMREASYSIQPARRASLKAVDALIHAGKIGVFQYSPDDLDATPEDSGSDLRASRMYRKALALGWLVGDFGPPLDGHGLPAKEQPHNQRLIFRSPHCIVESLQILGEISGETSANALAVLGPEHNPPIERIIDKGTSLVCGAGVLESLATEGALEAAANVFDLHLDSGEVETFIQSPLAGFDQADADTEWLTLLIERLTKGIEAGSYRLLPIFHDREARKIIPRTHLKSVA